LQLGRCAFEDNTFFKGGNYSDFYLHQWLTFFEQKKGTETCHSPPIIKENSFDSIEEG
jgi:hypothetical protein